MREILLSSAAAKNGMKVWVNRFSLKIIALLSARAVRGHTPITKIAMLNSIIISSLKNKFT